MGKSTSLWHITSSMVKAGAKIRIGTIQLRPVGKSGGHQLAEPALCQGKGCAGWAGTPSIPYPAAPQGPPLSLRHSLSKEENTCPCPQKSDLKGQPLAFSAFPLCYSREGDSSVCVCVREDSRGPGTQALGVPSLGAEPHLARGEGQGGWWRA